MNREKAGQIRQLYFNRKATQAQLAEQFGISQPSVARIISGECWS